MKDHCNWCHQSEAPIFLADHSGPLDMGKSFRCPQCDRGITLVTIRRACELVNVSKKTMYHWIHKGRVSTQKIASGRRLICLSSLLIPSGKDSDVHLELRIDEP